MTDRDEMAKVAEELGRKAFGQGERRSPALDGVLMDMLKGNKVGESAPALTAWLKGWDDANLAAVLGPR